MKCIVETTRDIMLIHVHTNESIHSHRPTLCKETDWVHSQISLRNLRILARDIPDSVTDLDWLESLRACDGDVDLAVSSFVAELNKPTMREGEPANPEGVFKELPPADPVSEVISPTKKFTKK